MRLIDELKRRKVFRVGVAYALLSWLVVQVTDIVAPALQLPDWTLTFVTWIAIIGFPIALFFAWAYELTPTGIKPDSEVDRSDSVDQGKGRQLNFFVLVLLVVAIGFMAWNGYLRDTDPGVPPGESSVASSGEDAAMSVAVLPFTNLSSISENAFFAAGVHEEILTNLSLIEGLRVISRTTALRYLDSDLTLREIGNELGVRYIVEGSVRRIKNHVRITVQLIDAQEDAHLWASNYDRELVDVFATQSQVAKLITNSVHLEVQPETVDALDDLPTKSVKAYDLYMRAMSLDRSEPESETALQRKRELLEAAVAEDADFTDAWGFLNETLDHIARTLLQSEWFGQTSEEREAALPEIRQAAQRSLDKAVALDPDNLQTLLARASDYVLEQESAEYRVKRKEFIDRAIELYPDSAMAWYVLAWWYRLAGDHPNATKFFHKALELDPLHAQIVEGSLIHFRWVGDQEMVTRLFERLAQIAPEKGSDQGIAEVEPNVKLRNLMALLVETADETLIDKFAEVLQDSTGKFTHEMHGLIFETYLMQWQNRVGELLNFDADGVLPDSPQTYEVTAYLEAMNVALAAQMIAGNGEDAERTAQHIVETAMASYSEGMVFGDQLKVAVVASKVYLGQLDELDSMRQRAFESESLNVHGPPSPLFAVLMQFDPEEAVRRLLDFKAKHPESFGTDVIAAFHISYRPIVVHPDMQAFFREEGKWVGYLAARVPEYAEQELRGSE